MREKIILRCGTMAFTLLFLFLVSTLAEEHEPFSDPYTFNPNDPASFDYVGGDYSTITDWSMVDWSQIPPSRIAEVPPNELDYSRLDISQRLEMNSMQVAANFEVIEDLSKDVNPATAEQAIQETYNVGVQLFSNSAQIRGNVLSTTFGKMDRVSLQSAEKSSYSNGQLTVRDDGSILFNTGKARELHVPSTDSLNIRAGMEIDEEVSFQGHELHGNFHFERGKMSTESAVTIDGFTIFSADNDDVILPTFIYFSRPEKPEGNSVVLTPQKVEVSTEENSEIVIRPETGNQFFDMLKWEYPPRATPRLIPDKRPHMQITVLDGAALLMESRADEGKTPLVHHSGGGQVYISNGRMELGSNEQALWLTPPEPFPRDLHEEINLDNSVAFEFTSDAPLMAGAVMRTSSSNRWLYTKDGAIVAGSNLGLLVSDSREVNMMKTEEDLQAKYPDMKFSLVPSPQVPARPEYYDGITANMAQVVDQWLKDKPGISPLLGEINFNTGNPSFANYRRMDIGERSVDISAVEWGHPAYPRMPMNKIDHEFGHVKDLYAEFRENPQDTGLLELYDAEAQRLGAQLAANEEYREFTGNLDRKIPLIDLPAVGGNLPFESAAEGRPDAIYEVSKGFGFGRIPATYELYRQYLARITGETGLTDYAFSKPREESHYVELPAEYSTLPLPFARRQPRLAQMEFDRINSLGIIDRNDLRHEWLYQPAEERYWAIVGGPESAYCRENGCGPCKLYTATCGAPR